MKVWIHLNGVQEGPYDLHELPFDRMTPETPVWCEGMVYWQPAKEAVITAEFFKPGGDELLQQRIAESKAHAQQASDAELAADSAAQQQPVAQGYPANRGYAPMGAQAAYAANQQAQQPCPATYIVWSILLTVLCCNPIGIVPIILGTLVSSKYRNYNFEGAKRTSETTAWWLIITIVTSLIMLPFSMLMTL